MIVEVIVKVSPLYSVQWTGQRAVDFQEEWRSRDLYVVWVGDGTSTYFVKVIDCNLDCTKKFISIFMPVC